MKKTLEILAPAGSFDSLKAAVHAGADAVYMGGGRFGARAYAENPEGENLLEAIDYAHLYGVKLYLTVNTLLKTKELERELYDYLKPCYEHGLDAVLVQDLGVMKAIQEWFPDLPIHASTQMTLCGVGGAKILEEAGAQRVVLARELSLKEIEEIHNNIQIEIECFVHGALCYCYSGQCFFSSILGGRSGNRGRCAQPCRLAYEVLENGKTISKKNESHVISPKDICALDLIPEMAKAGIYSLKIEGRMKRPEYVAGVVRIYRKYVDMYLKKGAKGYKTDPKDRQELMLLFNRDGFSEGYYHQHNGRDMMALQNLSMTDSEKKAYEKLIAYLHKEYVECEKKITVSGSFYAQAGEPMFLTLTAESDGKEFIVVSEGPCPQIPQNRPMEKEQIEKQLRKTGQTPFTIDELDIQLVGDLFIPVQALNAIRRDALDELKQKLVSESYRNAPDTAAEEPAAVEANVLKNTSKELHISVETKEQLSAVLKAQENLTKAAVPLTAVYLDAESLEDDLTALCKRVKEAGLKVYILLPTVFRMKTASRYEANRVFWYTLHCDGYVIKNLEEYAFFKGCQKAAAAADGEPHRIEKELILDHNMYTFNRRSRSLWREEGICLQTNPLELNARELGEISSSDSVQIIYGYYPMMTSAGCLHKTLGRCRHKEEIYYMKDRYQKEFPVKNYCRDCMNVIYNSQPLYLFDRMEEVDALGVGVYRMMFTVEDRTETDQVLENWKSLCKLKDGFTRGHFKRGVE